MVKYYRFLLPIVLLIIVAAVLPVNAVNRTWIGGGGDNYATTNANWNPIGPVQNGDHIIFDNSTVQNSSWNVTGITISSFTIYSGYSGSIIFESSITISENFFYQAAGLSTVRFGGLEHSVAGDFKFYGNNVDFDAYGSTIVFNGSSEQHVGCSADPIRFGTFRVASSSMVMITDMNNGILFDRIEIISGHFETGNWGSHIVYYDVSVDGPNSFFELGPSTVTVYDGFVVNNEATLAMYDRPNVPDILVMNFNSSYITVAGGSYLICESTKSYITSSNPGATHYSFDIIDSTVQITGLNIESSNLNGLNINGGSYIASLSSVTFINNAMDGVALQIMEAGTPEYLFSGLRFENNVSTNIRAPNISYPGYIGMQDCGGGRSGPTWEDDPEGIIYWASPGFCNIDNVTAVSTTAIHWEWSADLGNTHSFFIRNSTNGLVQELDRDATFYTETDLTINTSYYRYVQAWGPLGYYNSSSSEPYTLANQPGDASFGNIYESSITINWTNNNNPDYTEYIIRRSTVDTGDSSYLDQGTTTSLTFTNKFLTPNSSYYYRVYAQNGDHIVTAYTPTISTWTHAQPIGLSPFGSVTHTTITVNWGFGSNPPYTMYHLERSSWPEGIGGYSEITITTSTMYKDYPLTQDTSYFYRVRARNEVGIYTVYSSTDMQKTTQDYASPAASSITASAGDYVGSVRISWDSTGDDGNDWILTNGSEYRIQHSTYEWESWNYNSAQVIISTENVNPGEPQTYVVGGLDPGTTHWFILWTVDESSNFSNLSNKTSYYALLPANPTNNLTLYNSGTDGWMATMNGSGDERGYSVDTDSNGNIYVAGSFENGSNSDIFVRKYDPNGAVLWTKYYNGLSNGNDAANGIVVESNNVYVAGYITEGADTNIWFARYDYNGKLVWQNKVDSFAGNDVANDITASAANIFIAGKIAHATENDNWWVGCYNLQGYEQWISSYNNNAVNQNDEALGIYCFTGSEVYVTGYENTAAEMTNTRTQRLTTGGSSVWISTYNGTNNNNDYGESVVRTSNGNVFVVGRTFRTDGGQDDNIWIGNYDYTNGNYYTSEEYNNSTYNDMDAGYGIDADYNNYYYVTGYESLSTPDSNIWVRRYKDNLIEFTTTYSSPEPLMNKGFDIVVKSSNLYVTGYEDRSGQGNNLWLRKYVMTHPGNAPTGVNITTKTSTSIEWNWYDNSNNEEGFRVKLSSDYYNPLTNSLSGDLAANTTEWLHSGLTPNTSYQIYVDAFTFWTSTRGTSGEMVTFSNPPTGTSVVGVSSWTVTITCGDNGNPSYTDYQVHQSTWNGNYGGMGLSDYGLFPYEYEGLNGDTTYYFKIRTNNTYTQYSAYDIVVVTKTLDVVPPGKINNLNAYTETEEAKVQLTWTIPGDNEYTKYMDEDSQYRIEYSTDDAHAWDYNNAQIIRSTQAVGGFSQQFITGLTKGSTYYFRVWYADEIPNWSEISNGATAWARNVLLHDWIRSGTTIYASYAGNWSKNSLPSDGDSVRFHDTFNNACYWDLHAIQLSSMTIETNYTNQINLSSYVSINHLRQYDGTFIIDATSMSFTGDIDQTGGIFRVEPSTISFDGSLEQSISLNQDTTFYSMLFPATTVYFYNQRMFIEGDLDFNSGTFDTTGSTVSMRGDITYFGGGNDIQANSGKWIFDGDTTQRCGIGGARFYDVEVNKLGGGDFLVIADFWVGNNLLITSGTFNYGSYNLNIERNLNVTSPGVLTEDQGGILSFSGGENSAIDLPADYNIGALSIFKMAYDDIVTIANDLEIDGELNLNTGTFDIADHELRVDGITKGSSGNFIVTNSTVVITGDNYMLSGSSMSFSYLAFNNNATTGTFVNQFVEAYDISLKPNSKVILENEINALNMTVEGEFEVGAGTIGVSGKLDINSGGVLNLSTPEYAIVYVGDGLNVNANGVLISSMSTYDLITSTGGPDYFSFVVNGGTINVKNLDITYLDKDGLVIEDGSNIVELSSVTFSNVQSDGFALQILQAGSTQYTFESCGFDSSVSTNVYAPNLNYPGYILMMNAKGANGSYPYEQDPNDIIYWGPPSAIASFGREYATQTSINWVWPDSTEDRGYDVNTGTDGLRAVLSRSTTYWLETGLLPNTSYQRYVEAYNPLGTQVSVSSTIYTLTYDPTSSVLVTRDSYSITIDWSPNGNPEPGTDYLVRIASVPTFTSYNDYNPSTSTYRALSLDPYTTYFFRVASVNGDGIVSGFDSDISTRTWPAPIEPNTDIIFPSHNSYYNSLPQISGTAITTVAEGYIEEVGLQIINVTASPDEYWNGGSWVLTPSTTTANLSAPDWTYNFSFVNDTEYRIHAFATDNYGTVEISSATSVMYFDTQLPISTVTYPVEGSYQETLPTISGVMSDTEGPNTINAGIHDVLVRIQRQHDSQYWDGSSWIAQSTWSTSNLFSSSWTYITLPTWTSGYYTLNSRSVDDADNYEMDFSTVSFYMIGPATKLILTVPGESYTTGTGAYKTGTPSIQTAGLTFDATAYAVDVNYYLVQSTDSLVTIDSDDSYDLMPSPQSLINGTTVFSVNLFTATTTQLTITAPNLIDGTTNVFVQPAGLNRLQILLPGETSDSGSGSLLGVAGARSTIMAGNTIDITVNGTDSYWNKTDNSSVEVNLLISGAYQASTTTLTLQGGTTTFQLALLDATTDGWEITADDVNPNAYLSYVSTGILVDPNYGTQLLLVVPGEYIDPATSNGKGGAPSARQINVPFNVTVYATDNWFNIQPGSNPIVSLNSATDPGFSPPANQSLINGEYIFTSVIVSSQGSNTLYTNDTVGSLYSSTSTAMSFGDGTFPAGISDLTALIGSNHGEIRLEWTSPGDDGTQYDLDGYFHIRYTDAGQITDYNSPPGSWTQIDIATNTPALSYQSRIITGLTSWATYYFAIVAEDNASNIGAWSRNAGANSANYNFAADTATPSSNIDYPVDFSYAETLTAISGTATDADSGVENMWISINRNIDNMYWDGGAWIVPSTWSLAGYDAAESSWTYTTLPSWTSGYYTIGSKAQDEAGNYETDVSTITIYMIGPATKIILTVPGESFVNSGIKTGAPQIQTAGLTFDVTAYAVDDNNYIVPSETDNVSIDSDDPYDAMPAAAPFVNGTRVLSVNLDRSTTTQLTATSAGLIDGTTSVFVQSASADRLQVILPGESSDPGSPSVTGVTGTRSAYTVGEAFDVTVNVTDQYWNKKSTVSADVTLSSDGAVTWVSPFNLSLIDGTTQFRLALLDATTSGWIIQATDTNPGVYTTYQSSGILVDPNNGTKLLLVVPGEYNQPAVVDGKGGSPSARQINTSFDVTVYATDDWWNVQQGSNPVVQLGSYTDPGFVPPGSQQLVNGEYIFSVTMSSQGTNTIYVDDVSGGLVASTSTAMDFGDGTPPAGISDLTALIGNNHGEIRLEWTSPGDDGTNYTLDGYFRIRYTDVGPITDYSVPPGAFTQINIATNTAPLSYQSYIVTGLTPWTTYFFAIIAEDNVTNTSTWTLSGVNTLSYNFAADTTTPTAGINYPTEGSYQSTLSALSGTAADSDSGIEKMWISIERLLDNQYWDGGSWIGVSTWSLAGYDAVESSWTYTTVPAWTSGYYLLSAQAQDEAGNYEANISTVGFYMIGPATRLVLGVPGEAFAPNTAPGKTGVPQIQTAGLTFDVTAYALDDNYYHDTSTDSLVTVDSNDPYDSMPVPTALVSGKVSFSVTLYTATTTQLTISATGLTSDTTSVYVQPNASSKLQILLPGETAEPGSSLGYTGSKANQKAGASFDLTVNVVDDYWNRVEINEPQVELSINGGFQAGTTIQTLVSGTTEFQLTLIEATTSGWEITATDIDGTGTLHTLYTSTGILVDPNDGTKLLVVVPGEYLDPATSNGKGGSPSGRLINTPFDVTVYATDDWWNLQIGSNPTVQITSADDPGFAPPSNQALVNGEQTFSITISSQGTNTICATDIDGGLTSSTSTAMNFSDATPPAAISDLTALIGNVHGSVLLQWTSPGDDGTTYPLNGYFHIRYTDAGQITDYNSPPGSWSQIDIATNTPALSAQQYQVEGLTPWTSYYFAIVAVDNAFSTSTWSTSGVNTENYRVAADTELPYIVNSVVGDDNWRNASGTQYDLDFKERDSGLASIQYTINNAPNQSGNVLYPWNVVDNISAGATYYDTDWQANWGSLVEYATNYVSIRAYDIAGNMYEESDVFYVLKDTTIPTVPILVGSPPDGGSVGSPVSFNWGDSNDATSGLADSSRYIIDLAIDENFASIEVTSYTYTSDATISLATSGWWWWRVGAYDKAGNFSGYSSSNSINVSAAPPNAPSGFGSVALSTDTIYWYWEDQSGEPESEYRLHYATGIATDYISLPADTTEYYSYGLTPDEWRSHYVISYNDAGSNNTSTITRYSFANIPIIPMVSTVTYQSVALEWGSNDNPGTVNYQVVWSTCDVFSIIQGTTTATTALSQQVNSLLAETSYYLKIFAVNTDGFITDYSTVVSTFTPPGPPSAPSSFTGVAQSTTSILWSWIDVNTRETGYRLYSSTGGLIVELGVNTTYYLEESLTANGPYARQAVAYNISGENTLQSYLTVYTLANPPSGLSHLSKDSESITLAWTKPYYGVTRYFIERSLDGSTFSQIVDWDDALATESYTDTGLTHNTTYYYRVSGYNGDAIVTSPCTVYAVMTDYLPPEQISGKVTQADDTPITGVEVIAEKEGTTISYTVFTSTNGTYLVELDAATAEGTYKITASWTANDITSSVYIEGIVNGTGDVDFTLEVQYELAEIVGTVTIARNPAAGFKAIKKTLSPAYVELIQKGRVIARINTDSKGKYSIPNLLPGRYSVRAFNGIAYSKTTIVDLKEGDVFNVTFDYDLLNPDKVYAYPNPAVDKDKITIHFETLGQEVDATINIFTISGELVKTLSNSDCVVEGNIYECQWNLKNNDNDDIASGVYIYQVKVRNRINGERASIMKKMAIVR